MRPYKELRWPRFWPFLRVVDELPATKRGKRKATNDWRGIRIRRDVLDNEPWVLQQEIYESRYWLRHPWRLVDFYWFNKFEDNSPVYSWAGHNNHRKYVSAAAHLASVECQSRAQEIRAKWDCEWGDVPPNDPTRVAWVLSDAREYAASIHGATNYPYIKAAGWTEDDCYNEIIKHL